MGGPTHTKVNTVLVNTLFRQENWILCPPTSSDFTFPIENLWTNLKKMSKIEIRKSMKS